MARRCLWTAHALWYKQLYTDTHTISRNTGFLIEQIWKIANTSKQITKIILFLTRNLLFVCMYIRTHAQQNRSHTTIIIIQTWRNVEFKLSSEKSGKHSLRCKGYVRKWFILYRKKCKQDRYSLTVKRQILSSWGLQEEKEGSIKSSKVEPSCQDQTNRQLVQATKLNANCYM